MSRIYRIDQVHATELRSHPPSIAIAVIGAVNSSGWTQARLVPWVYRAPPEDGIYDFDFIATPPTDIALEVITPIAHSQIIPNHPKDLKGVRVHATSNSLSAPLNERGPALSDFASSPKRWLPWPRVDGYAPWPRVDTIAKKKKSRTRR